MGCTSDCMKCILNIINTLFGLCGIGLIAVGVLNLDSYPPKYVYLILIVGSCTLLSSILGCCGVCHENVCMTATYAVLILTSLIAQVYIKVVPVSLDEIRDIAHKEVQKTWEAEKINPGAMDKTQQTFKCCGIYGPGSYENNPIRPSCFPNNSIDEMKGPFRDGCFQAAAEYYLKITRYVSKAEWGGIALSFKCCGLVGPGGYDSILRGRPPSCYQDNMIDGTKVMYTMGCGQAAEDYYIFITSYVSKAEWGGIALAFKCCGAEGPAQYLEMHFILPLSCYIDTAKPTGDIYKTGCLDAVAQNNIQLFNYAVSVEWGVLAFSFKCCGLDEIRDYIKIGRQITPASCYPDNVISSSPGPYQIGCYTATTDSYLKLTGYVASAEWGGIAFSAVMFFFAIYLVFRFNNSQRRYRY